jgi:hypothetical protein
VPAQAGLRRRCRFRLGDCSAEAVAGLADAGVVRPDQPVDLVHGRPRRGLTFDHRQFDNISEKDRRLMQDAVDLDGEPS